MENVFANKIQTWIAHMSITAYVEPLKHSGMCCIWPHLYPRSETCRTLLMPRPLQWPGWPLWRPAGDGKGLYCPCLLLPEEIKWIMYHYIALKLIQVQMLLVICWGCTLDAATSWAVLAAISCEHTISSSNLPLPCTTWSAASLQEEKAQWLIYQSMSDSKLKVRTLWKTRTES